MRRNYYAMQCFSDCLYNRGICVEIFVIVFLAQYISCETDIGKSLLTPIFGNSMDVSGEPICDTNVPIEEQNVEGSIKDSLLSPQTHFFDPFSIAYNIIFPPPTPVEPPPRQDAEKNHSTNNEVKRIEGVLHILCVHAAFLFVTLSLWIPHVVYSKGNRRMVQWRVGSALLSCSFSSYVTCMLIERYSFVDPNLALMISLHTGTQLLHSYSRFVKHTPEIHMSQWFSTKYIALFVQIYIICYGCFVSVNATNVFVNTVLSLVVLQLQRSLLYFPIVQFSAWGVGET